MQATRQCGDAAARASFGQHRNELLTLRSEDKLKLHPFAIQHLLARMFEIHRDPAINRRLHLPKTPIRAGGVAHQHARVQNGANSLFRKVAHG